jgi:putative peptidoglycan lipid II flippase
VLVAFARTLDWIGLQAHPGLRIVWLAVAMAVAAAVYFGTLSVAGLRPSHFIHRA